MKRPAIGYCRVSTEDQSEKGISLEAQAEKIRQYAALHDLDLLDAPSDPGISGKSMRNRPGVSRALALAKERRGVLIVYSISRLSRSVKDLIDVAEQLRDAGCDLVSVSESIDTTSAMGRAFFTIIAVFAQLEREQTVERTQSAMDHLRNSGEFLGNAPYGFMRDPQSPPPVKGGERVPQPLVPDPLEQVGLAMILAAMGKPPVAYAGLARALEAIGKPRKGKRWDRGVVRQIVKFHESAEGVLLRSQHGLATPLVEALAV